MEEQLYDFQVGVNYSDRIVDISNTGREILGRLLDERKFNLF